MSAALPPSTPLHFPAPAALSAPGPGASPLVVQSTDLLRGQKTVEISHNGATYRLQATRLGKLILTK
jgi:hemin uptake protein HemP